MGRKWNTRPVTLLADAMEKARCGDTVLLNLCRGSSVHVRGCWVFDLLLGKSRHQLHERNPDAGGWHMGWASGHIAQLKAGETVSFRPRGNSMSGKIESGQLCTVEPVDPTTLAVGDIVLCKVNGREYLHLVKAIQGPRLQIGNNRGRVNGWVSATAIFGKCVADEA